jgi:hypothetical protein
MKFWNVVHWLRNATTGALTPVSSAAPLPVADAAVAAALAVGITATIAPGTKIVALPSNAAVTYTNPTATMAGVPVVAASAATAFLDIQNLSGTVTVNLLAGGLIIRTLLPFGTYTREGSNIPPNAITAQAASGTALMSVGVA